ncbi:aminodeoxychorismate synthase component I [Hellea sp.]|nr:aminodeoxychorismate synthase component I [Hellea sp.]
MSQTAPYILLDDQLTHEQRYYSNPIDIIEVDDVKNIDAAFAKLKTYHEEGYYLAGYLSYELGYALEPKLAPLMPETRDGPLLQFGVFETVSHDAPAACLYTSQNLDTTLKPHWNEAEYEKLFDRVMDYIRAGDVYQINLTFPMTGTYQGNTETLYAAFRHRQKGRYGGIVSLGPGPDIISLSPELFFRKEGNEMSMRPMKGTRPRAENSDADNSLREDMRAEEKSQAENLMIVDLLRNDLSRISETGSVKVPELFALETYPTLHQMTSRVTSCLKPRTDFAEIFKSLFPCGSVTGAPKIRAMEIIDELEESERGTYCGSLGYIDPNGDACFNVAIRTLILNEGKLRYNVGSGLVLDSEPAAEYAECLLKADVLKPAKTELIETFLWDTHAGSKRIKAHKTRMKKSAKAMGYSFSDKAFDETLRPLESCINNQRVRLTLNSKGDISLIHSDFLAQENLTFAMSKYPLTSDVQTTRHKLSARQFYDGERERVNALTGAGEVVFLNKDGQLCEGSFTSLFIEKNGQLFTPSLSAGLLPGILRAELIETGKAIEKTLLIDDLRSADKIYLGNSLRGLLPAKYLSLELC